MHKKQQRTVSLKLNMLSGTVFGDKELHKDYFH